MTLLTERSTVSGLLMQMKMDDAFAILTRHWREAADEYDKGDAELWLGYAYFYMSDYRNAARYFRDGVQKLDADNYTRKTSNWGGNYPFPLYLVDRGLQKLAYCYWKLGKLSAAKETSSDALRILEPLLEATNDPYQRSSAIWSTIRVLEALGQVHEESGEPELAISTHRHIVELCDQMLEFQTPTVGSRGTTLMLRSRALLAAGEAEAALKDADAAIAENEKQLKEYVGTTQSEVFDHHHRVQVLLAMDRPQDALQSSLRALEIAEDRRVPEFQPASYALLKTWLVPSAAFHVGEQYRRLAMFDKAEAAYRRSIEATEQIYATSRSLSIRQSFSNSQGVFEQREPAYERLAELLAARGAWQEAFAIAEKGRSRAMLDALGNAPPRETGPWAIDDSLLERDRHFANKLVELIRVLQSANAQSSVDVRAVAEELRRTQEDYATFRNTLVLQHPGYAVFQTIQTVTTEDLSTLFVDHAPLHDAVLVSYLVTDEVLLGFCFDGSELHSLVLSQDAGEVCDNIKRLRDQIESRASDWRHPARQLHERLIAPFTKYLKGKRKLLVVPHGPLNFLPFAALTDESGRPLVEQYEIGQLPSASMLRVWADRDRREQEQSQPWTRALAVANPDGSLPFAESEGEMVRNAFPQSEVLVGQEAQEGRYLLLAPEAHVIHVATHGVLNRIQPAYSHLVLAEPPENDPTVDGLLDVHEIVRKLDAGQARLVVLSACQTSVGETTSGDEVQSLANAFLYAGARQVVASLWSVDDQGTAELMQRFYSAQRNGGQSLGALREAMLRAIEKDQHPYFWAGFHIIGER